MSEFNVRSVPIESIRIGPRHRKDLGDLRPLAESIERGLLQPIGVTPPPDLVWGQRRLLACRDLLGRAGGNAQTGGPHHRRFEGRVQRGARTCQGDGTDG